MINELKDMPLFYEIDHNVLEPMIQQKQIFKRSYPKGVTVHEQSSECNVMDVVCTGKLVAYALATNGSEFIVFEFGPGSIVGANLLFGEQNQYPMNIYCTTDSILIHITKSGTEELLKEYGFVMRFVQALSMKSQSMNQKIAIYRQKSLRKNLVDYFLALSAQQKSNTVTLTMTKKQLADYFGVQRPSLFRELKRMKDEGLLEIDNKKITIKFSDE